MPLLLSSDLKFSAFLLNICPVNCLRSTVIENPSRFVYVCTIYRLLCVAFPSSSCQVLFLFVVVGVIHREGVGVKRKQKQRKTKKLGWLCGAGPDSGKKKIACFVLLRVHLGVLVLSRSRSQCECLRMCVLHHQSCSATRFRRSGVRQLERWEMEETQNNKQRNSASTVPDRFW